MLTLCCLQQKLEGMVEVLGREINHSSGYDLKLDIMHIHTSYVQLAVYTVNLLKADEQNLHHNMSQI